MRFIQRATFMGGPNDITVPAAITNERPTSNDADSQRLVTGGRIEFYVRNNATAEPIRTRKAGQVVTFPRWDDGVEYTVTSVQVIKRGRFLRVMCERA